MSQELNANIPLIPETAMDENGVLLGPDRIPLDVLLAPSEIARFAESVAELTQMECSVVLYDPEQPRPVRSDGEVQTVRAPICKTLNALVDRGLPRCVRDVHAAGHEAMAAGKPASGGCVGGTNTLYACPIMLAHLGDDYPKAAVVAAAQDIYNFYFADRLAQVLKKPIPEAEDLMCRTDQRCLNAAQLRRLRAIMDTQTRAYSQQIGERYAQFESAALALQQKEELAHAYSLLDAECREVGEIQRNLVSRTPREIPGFAIATHYTPARRAGGDYYDFCLQPDGSWCLVVADVSGHGPGAAVVMGMLRAILHTFFGRLVSPLQALEYANRHLYDNIMEDQFVTAFFGILNPRTGSIRFGSAGHELPLLFDARTRDVRKLAVKPGLPLGIQRDNSFHLDEVQIKSGDVLLLYTDGITETHNPKGELFGVPRLVQTLRSHAGLGAPGVRDAILEHSVRFAEGEPPEDDQTLVVLQRL